MPTRRQQWLGCGGCLVVLAGLLALLVSVAKALGPLIVALIAVVVVTVGVLYLLARRRAVEAFRAEHRSDGKDVLIVYTDSPHWKDHIESTWLPRWGHRSVVLNRSRPWSEASAEARLWRAVGGRLEHTPAVILVPRRGRVRIVRFWLAFRDHKHGKDRALREAEARLAQLLEGGEA